MSFQSIDEIIRHYKKEGKKLTNEAALGYMIIAAKAVGIKPSGIEKLEISMREAMDEKTEEEAEEAYKSN